MQNNPECVSRRWWPTIKALAKSYESNLIEDFKIVQLSYERLEDALKIYELGWWSFKEQVYKKNAKAEMIDIHKIIAMYILSFLKNEPFHFGEPESDDDDKELAFLSNEYFCMDLLRILISACAEKDNAFQMSENDKNWFIIFLNNLKFKHLKLDMRIISPDKETDMVDILALAQIVYYIEKVYT